MIVGWANDFQLDVDVFTTMAAFFLICIYKVLILRGEKLFFFPPKVALLN